ncbi:alternate-type signal peptide domain-containing protein [uncultured Nocardioides sp.]|jgi:alternate signal-mediated exported protein|uniref:alternate-type signal peptide domain-containing protein n=1 Tax=uncultured Nocardioides sp. TaxID=198441 RepID=UPI0030F901E8
MRTSLKAALAGVAGAGLLLGGAGSLAFWNDTEDVPGGTIESGVLNLGSPVCDDWQLDGSGGAFSLDGEAPDVIVPGDTISQTCELDLDVVGKHLTATLSASAPSLGDSELDNELVASAVYELDSDGTDSVGPDASETAITPQGGPVAFSDADNGKLLRVTVTLAFPFNSTDVGNVEGLDNGSNNASDYNAPAVVATLDNITITALQTNTDH